MIRAITLREFKAFRNLRLQARPLTILVGENNSGKSSVLAALRLLAQTIQSEDRSIPILLSGPMGDFGAFRDVVHGNHRGRPMSLGLTLDALSPQSSSSRRPRPAVRFESQFKYRTQRRDTILRSTELWQGPRSLVSVISTREQESLVMSKVGGWKVPDAARAALTGARLDMVNFLPRIFSDRTERQSRSVAVNSAHDRTDKIQANATRAHSSISRTLARLEHLGPMRKAPERTYVNTGVSGRRIGTDGSNWPAVLALDAARRNPRLGLVQQWLARSGVAGAISVTWLTDRHYEIVVTNPVTGETENIADVGQGTSQVLPVLVAGARLRAGDTFVVEEPEIHLHPRAQAELGDFFVELATNGVQCFVETHSEYLIMRLQQFVASGLLPPEMIVFHYVSSTPEGKHVSNLVLDEFGALQTDMPGGFFPQRLAEASNLARVRAERRID